jgi:exopolysaccharide biosynthesis polyprenyl glycosylphosphotransferase
MSPRQVPRTTRWTGGGRHLFRAPQASRGPTKPNEGHHRPNRVVAVRHRPRDSAVRRLLGASDVMALAISQVVVLGLIGRPANAEQLAFAALVLPLWIVLFHVYGLYDRDVKRISHTTVDDLPWLFHAMLVGSLLFWLYFRLLPARDVNARELLGLAALSMITVLLLRSLTRRTQRRVLGGERVLLLGGDPQLEVITRKMSAHPEYGLHPVGVLSSSERGANGATHANGAAHANGTPPVLGSFTSPNLSELLAEHRIDRIIVSHPDVHEDELLELVRRCREMSIKVSVLPQLFDVMGPSVEVDDIEGITVLGLPPPVLPRSSRMLKRAMDIAGATTAVVLLAPLVAFAAVAIKLDSPGPVFFTQERVGRRGRKFKLFKLRTMEVGAHERQEELAALSRDRHWLDLDHDPRVTRVGRFLRRTSMDELPQLWNVLKGEMSLVGPRPIIETEARQLDGWRLSRVDLTPGLTGLWQVLGRTQIPFAEMIKLDYLYITNWSLWTDVRLILRTLPIVLARRGAN